MPTSDTSSENIKTWSVPAYFRYKRTTSSGTTQILTPWLENNTGTRRGYGCLGYRRKLRSGINATTAMVGSTSTTSFDSVIWRIDYYNKFAKKNEWQQVESELAAYRSRGQLVPPAGPTSSLSNKVVAEALGKFQSRVQGANTQLMGLVELAELKKTLQLIKRPASSIRDALGDYLDDIARNVRRRRLASVPKIIAGTWLEYEFGIKNLAYAVSDADDARLAIANHDKFAIVQARAENSEQWSHSFEPGYSAEASIYYDRHRSSGVTVSQRYLGAVRRSDEPIQRSLRAFGLWPDQFVPSVVELMPYTWLADYFLNVSDILNGGFMSTSLLSWSVSTKRTHSWADYTMVYNEAVTKQRGAVAGLLDIQVSAPNSHAKRHSTTVDRASLGSFIPPLVVNTNLPVEHAMNVAALALKGRRLERDLSAFL